MMAVPKSLLPAEKGAAAAAAAQAAKMAERMLVRGLEKSNRADNFKSIRLLDCIGQRETMSRFKNVWNRPWREENYAKLRSVTV